MATMRRNASKIQTIVLILAIFSVGFIVGNYNSIASAQNTMGDTDQAFGVVNEVYNLIHERYVGASDVEVPEIVDGALTGMIESLDDRFSSYLNPDDFVAFNTQMNGEYEGIGATITEDEETGYITVVSLIAGAAAEKAGVLPNDIFWEVNGESVVGLTSAEVGSIVRGPAGTEVTVVFKRGEEFITLTLTRVKFQTPNVESEVLPDTNIGYLRLYQFQGDSNAQVIQALDDLDVNSRDALIFDVRGNPGGLLSSVIDIASLFIQDDVILYEAYGDGSEDTIRTNGSYYGVTVPIIFLTDEGSASASELLVGAVKDQKVGTLIGEKTFGKGTVQTIQPISNGGAVRITIARWLTPNRNWIHDVGITPDMVVPYDPATDGVDADPQLDAAIEYIGSLQ